LNNLGRILLTRLYNLRIWWEHPKRFIYFQASSREYRKVNTLLASKYPEIPPNEKIPGVEIYAKNSAQCQADLAPWYNAYLDLVQFQKIALEGLQKVSHATDISYATCPDLTAQFFSLVVTYVQLFLLATESKNYKTFIPVYGLCYRLSNNFKNEDNYDNIVKFLEKYEKHIWATLIEEMKPIAPTIINCLAEFLPLDEKLMAHGALVDEGTFSLTKEVNKLNLYHWSPFMDFVQISPKVHDWCIYGLTLCPDQLNEAVLPLQKLTVKFHGPLTCLYREIGVSLGSDCCTILEGHKPSKKEFKKEFKKHVKDMENVKKNSIQTAGAEHSERRKFITHDLSAIACLIQDSPGLIPPKLEIILAALAIAREEIFWYFRHIKPYPPIKSKHFKPQSYEDPKISQLIHLVFQIHQSLLDDQTNIQQYYHKLAKSLDLPELVEISKNSTAILADYPETSALLNSLISTIQQSNPNFEGIRHAWRASQLRVANPRQAFAEKIAPIATTITRCVTRTRYIDALPAVLTATSMAELWFHKEKIVELFKKTVTDSPEYISAFFYLLTRFPENATTLDAKQLPYIGEEVVEIGQNFVHVLQDSFTNLVTDLVEFTTFYLDEPSKPKHAIYNIYLQAKKGEIPKWSVPLTPGLESNYEIIYGKTDLPQAADICKQTDEANPEEPTEEPASPAADPSTPSAASSASGQTASAKFEKKRKDMESNSTTTFRSFQDNRCKLAHLCGAICQYPEYQIYDTQFRLDSSLFLWMKNLLSGFLKKELHQRGGSIQPPASIIRNFTIYLAVLKSLQVPFDIDNLIASILKEELCCEINLAPTTEAPGEAAATEEAKFTKAISEWYAKFAVNQLKAKNVQYSSLRRGFVTKGGEGGVDVYADFPEIVNLCSVIGPIGVGEISKQLLREISKQATLLEGSLKHMTDLKKLQESYKDESETANILKSVRSKELDQLTNICVAIGNLVAFRGLFLDALCFESYETVPFLHPLINATERKKQNKFNDTELSNVFKPLVQANKDAWAALPAALAVSIMLATQWKDAVYDAGLHVYDNGLHVLAQTVPILIHTVETNSEPAVLPFSMNLQFLTLAGTLLLRVAKSETSTRHRKDLASSIIFIDLVMQECPQILPSQIEKVIPAALIRSMWRDIKTRGEIPQ